MNNHSSYLNHLLRCNNWSARCKIIVGLSKKISQHMIQQIYNSFGFVLILHYLLICAENKYWRFQYQRMKKTLHVIFIILVTPKLNFIHKSERKELLIFAPKELESEAHIQDIRLALRWVTLFAILHIIYLLFTPI